MKSHGPSLRSLRIMKFPEQDDITEPAQALRSCTRLEEFVYGAAVRLDPTMLEALPSTIEHLQVSLLVRDEEFTAFLLRQANLKVVSCTYRQPMLTCGQDFKKVEDTITFRDGIPFQHKSLSYEYGGIEVSKGNSLNVLGAHVSFCRPSRSLSQVVSLVTVHAWCLSDIYFFALLVPRCWLSTLTGSSFVLCTFT